MALTEIVLPVNLEKIGENAFDQCPNITKITVPGKVRTLSAGAFDICANLYEVIIEEGVESIGDENDYRAIFSYCPKLTKIFIPETVKSIDKRAFEKSSNLIIYGVPGSYAQQYAVEKDIPFMEI